MASFKDKLFSEYPIPRALSIYGGDGVMIDILEDIDSLIECCVDDMGSDVCVYDYAQVTGIATKMPKDCITVTSAMLSSQYPFQGNRLVKVTYQKDSNTAFVNYYPATLTYIRPIRVSDLDTLTGDRLIYMKSYVLWKMSEKELSTLLATQMNVDNGVVNFSILESFRDKMYDRYLKLKEEILLYATAY